MTIDEQTAFVYYKATVAKCYSKKSRYYKNVGAKGIGMCKRWRQSFENFLKDMGPPRTGQVLVRIDGNGPFNKNNCMWAG